MSEHDLICPICGIKSKNLNFYSIHANNHKNKELYPNGIDCIFCGKHFPTLRGFKRHVTENHDSYENKIKVYQFITGDYESHVCENCGEPAFLDLKYDYKSWCKKCEKIVYKKHHDKAMKNMDTSKIDYKARNAKSIKTSIKNHGVRNPNQNPEVIAKGIETKKQRYGENFGEVISNRSRETYLKNTGYDNPWKNPKVIEQMVQKKKENLPDGHTFFTKAFDTMERETGYRYPSQNPDCLLKGEETSLKNWGTRHPQQNKEIKKQTTLKFLENREKGLHKNYWDDPEFKKASLQKQYETKRINNSFNKSKKEDELFETLVSSLNVLIERQKRDPVRFPFNCDFYFPNYDLFVDFHGTWLHGGEKFDVNNKNHIEKLNYWKKESSKRDKKSLWDNAIYTWTDLDIRKYDFAKKNNLNYLTFYTYDFELIVNTIYEKLKTLQYFPVCNFNDEIIINELNLIKSKSGNYNSVSKFNKTILQYQPHFYEIEKEMFKDDEIRNKLISNREKYLNKTYEQINDLELLRGFKISGLHIGFSHFSPLWIKAFIEEFNVKSIYDPCGGWGHRFLGSTNIKYIYNDIDERTIFGVKSIKNLYEKTFNKKTKNVFYNLDASTFTPKEKYDAVFTCPPYYNKEKYTNECSSSNLETYEEWLDWLKLTIEMASKNCKKYIAIVMSPEYGEDLKKIMIDYTLIKELNLGQPYHNFKSGTEGKYKDKLFVYKLTI